MVSEIFGEGGVSEIFGGGPPNFGGRGVCLKFFLGGVSEIFKRGFLPNFWGGCV